MPFSILSAFILMVWISVSLVVAENNCDKYCFKSCDDYWPGWKFSECVQANTYCSCEAKISRSTGDPFVTFIIIACVFLAVFFCGLCCRCLRSRRQNNSSGTIYPYGTIALNPGQQTTVIAAPVTRMSSTNNINTNPSDQYQADPESFINPVAPQSNPHVPPEYMEPPPPYNECVKDENFQSEKERLLK